MIRSVRFGLVSRFLMNTLYQYLLCILYLVLASKSWLGIGFGIFQGFMSMRSYPNPFTVQLYQNPNRLAKKFQNSIWGKRMWGHFFVDISKNTHPVIIIADQRWIKLARDIHFTYCITYHFCSAIFFIILTVSLELVVDWMGLVGMFHSFIIMVSLTFS